MKKYLSALIILSLLLFSGCGGKKDNPEEIKEPEIQPPKQEEPKIEEPKIEDPKSEDVPESKINEFPEAAQGRFTDFPIKFKDTRESVVKQLGEPDEISSWQGSELYVYDNIGIYIDPTEDLVTGLTAGEGYKTFGIEIGMTADEIKSKLGKPDFEGNNMESGAYILEYEAGEYVVEIALDAEKQKSVGVTVYSYNY